MDTFEAYKDMGKIRLQMLILIASFDPNERMFFISWSFYCKGKFSLFLNLATVCSVTQKFAR